MVWPNSNGPTKVEPRIQLYNNNYYENIYWKQHKIYAVHIWLQKIKNIKQKTKDTPAQVIILWYPILLNKIIKLK